MGLTKAQTNLRQTEKVLSVCKAFDAKQGLTSPTSPTALRDVKDGKDGKDVKRSSLKPDSLTSPKEICNPCF